MGGNEGAWGSCLAFSKYLAWFSAPHRLDNGMGCPLSLPLARVGTELFSRDIDKYSIIRGADEQIRQAESKNLWKPSPHLKASVVSQDISVQISPRKNQTCILRPASCRYNRKVPVCACCTSPLVSPTLQRRRWASRLDAQIGCDTVLPLQLP